MTASVRRAAVAGTWYPGDAKTLTAELDGYLAQASTPPVPGRLVALICPHAGLRYSGPVAAYSYSLLRGRRDLTVVLVGPSHRYTFSRIAMWPRGGFETPLGTAPVDEATVEAIRAAAPDVVIDAEQPHVPEHSLEMQLPFLQHVVSGLRVVPLLMGDQSRERVEGLSAALVGALPGRGVVLVASSDLSHYNPAPVANTLDAEVIGDVERFDAEGLMARLEVDHAHACGGGPIVAVMRAARGLGANRATILRYADSGDAGERDKSHVVGYLAAALSAA